MYPTACGAATPGRSSVKQQQQQKWQQQPGEQQQQKCENKKLS